MRIVSCDCPATRSAPCVLTPCGQEVFYEKTDRHVRPVKSPWPAGKPLILGIGWHTVNGCHHDYYLCLAKCERAARSKPGPMIGRCVLTVTADKERALHYLPMARCGFRWRFVGGFGNLPLNRPTSYFSDRYHAHTTQLSYQRGVLRFDGSAWASGSRRCSTGYPANIKRGRASDQCAGGERPLSAAVPIRSRRRRSRDGLRTREGREGG
jgi:hypothetical protein